MIEIKKEPKHRCIKCFNTGNSIVPATYRWLKTSGGEIVRCSKNLPKYRTLYCDDCYHHHLNGLSYDGQLMLSNDFVKL